MIFYFRFGKVGLGECPQGWAMGPAGLEPPAGLEIGKKLLKKYDKTPLKRRCHEILFYTPPLMNRAW